MCELYSIILQHPTLGLTRQHYLCTVCRKELQAVADTNLDDLQTNTGGDIDGIQATSVDAMETDGDVQESKQSIVSASKENSVEEVSSEKLQVTEKGVSSTPNPQHTNTLSLQTGEAVKTFNLPMS